MALLLPKPDLVFLWFLFLCFLASLEELRPFLWPVSISKLKLFAWLRLLLLILKCFILLSLEVCLEFFLFRENVASLVLLMERNFEELRLVSFALDLVLILGWISMLILLTLALRVELVGFFPILSLLPCLIMGCLLLDLMLFLMLFWISALLETCANGLVLSITRFWTDFEVGNKFSTGKFGF